MNGRVFNWAHDLHPPFQIARHPIGRGKVHFGVRIGQFRPGPETYDARVLEETPDYRFNPDIFRQALHAGSEAADAAHDELDLHAFAASAVKRIDDFRMHQRIELGPDGAVAPGARMGDLILDQAQQHRLHVQGRDGELFPRDGLGVTGDIIEQTPGIAPKRRIAGEQRKILIRARGDGVIIAGAEMGVGAQPVGFTAHHQAHFGVGLEIDKAVHDRSAGAFEALGHADIGLFVETRFQLDQRGDVLAGLGGGHQSGDDR